MIAVVGLGNELLCDEGFGINVVRELRKIHSPSLKIDFLEGGVSGHTLLPLFFDYEYIIFLDVIKTHDEPGSIYQFPMDDVCYVEKMITSFHDIGIEDVYKLAKIMGSKAKCYVVAMVPECIDIVGSPTKTLLDKKEKFISIVNNLILKCLGNNA